jgi:hypothetical protein
MAQLRQRVPHHSDPGGDPKRHPSPDLPGELAAEFQNGVHSEGKEIRPGLSVHPE